MSKIMLAKLAWNENRWQGWDQKGYENRNKYNYRFIKEHGYAHEWWNFYDFDDENFYGHIEIGNRVPQKFEEGGLVIFVSYNVYDNNFYIIGFYDGAEFKKDGYEATKTLWETLPENARGKIREDANNGQINPKSLEYLKNRIFSWRGKKSISTVFKEYAQFDVRRILDIHWGQAPFIYVDEELKPKIVRLLSEVLEKHEILYSELQNTESDENEAELEETNSIIEKIETVLEKYFKDVTIGHKSLDEFIENLITLKNKYGREWELIWQDLEPPREKLERVSSMEKFQIRRP